MKQKQNRKYACLSARQGFTLIELLIVIAIIGILTSIVLVSTRSGVDKAKRSSALTTASSVLSELVACQDDGGNIAAYSGNAGTATPICSAAGHSAPWPATNSSGWNISASAVSNGNIPDNYTFTVVSPNPSVYPNISCNLATSMCQ